MSFHRLTPWFASACRMIFAATAIFLSRMFGMHVAYMLVCVCVCDECFMVQVSTSAMPNAFSRTYYIERAFR